MRLIDADELLKCKFHPLPYTHITPTDVNAESYKRGWNDALDAVADNAPTIDPVVRCKDCENWERDWSTLSESSSHFCPMMDTFTEPDEFCSRAERRSDETDRC